MCHEQILQLQFEPSDLLIFSLNEFSLNEFSLNAHNNSQDAIPEVIDTAPLQENQTNYIVMDEYFYSEELEEKLMKNEDDVQNLWEGFDLLWDYVEDGKNRLNQTDLS